MNYYFFIIYIRKVGKYIWRVKELRKKLGLTQSEMGEKLSLSGNLVYMMEKGERAISDRTVKDICRDLNVNEEWLRTGEGEMFQNALELSSTQVLLEALERDHGKPFPSMVKAIAEIYAEADEVDRQVLNRLVDELLEKMKK